MNVLITGCAGLLGSRMLDWIVDNQHDVQVIGVDDLSGGYMDNVNPGIHRFHEADLSEDSDYVNEIFEKYQPDLVYHFAAYAAEGLSPFIRRYNYKNNLLSTAAVINNCITHNVSRLVFTSSMAVYGDQEAPFEETLERKPIDPYGIAKAACEADIEIASHQHGLDYTIIRPHNVYGRKQNIWDRYRNVLGIWMNQHLNGKPLTIFGDGTQKRAFSCIDDCLRPMWKAGISSETSGEIINLGATEEISILEACDTLINVMGGGEKVFLEGRHEVSEAWSSYQKSVDILDYKDNTTLHEGLSDMWAWAKTQPRRQVKNMDYEVEKGIYAFWK